MGKTLQDHGKKVGHCVYIFYKMRGRPFKNCKSSTVVISHLFRTLVHSLRTMFNLFITFNIHLYLTFRVIHNRLVEQPFDRSHLLQRTQFTTHSRVLYRDIGAIVACARVTANPSRLSGECILLFTVVFKSYCSVRVATYLILPYLRILFLMLTLMIGCGVIFKLYRYLERHSSIITHYSSLGAISINLYIIARRLTILLLAFNLLNFFVYKNGLI